MAMKLKGEPITVGLPASEEDMQVLFNQVHFIDPSLTRDNLKSEVIQASSPLQQFLTTDFVFASNNHLTLIKTIMYSLRYRYK